MEDLTRRLEFLEGVARIQTRLAEASLDLDGFMATVVEQVARATHGAGVIVELVDGEDMVYRATSPDLQAHLGLRLRRRGSLSGLCVEAGETLYCADSEADPRVDREACRRVGLRSMICAPLVTGGSVVGVLKALAPGVAQFAPAEIEALEAIAASLAAALAKQVAFEALQAETQARRRVETMLRAREAQANRIIAEAHHAIVTMDAQGHVRTWNRSAEAIFGWTAAEAAGRSLAELIVPPEQRQAHSGGLQRYLATGESKLLNQTLEVEAVRKGGARRLVELAITAAEEPQGVLFTALMQDVTERKAQAELFETAFEHAPIGVAVVALDGPFLKVNGSLCELLGYSADELLATDFQTITHPDDLGADLELLERLTRGELPAYQMDKRYRRKDGSLVWVNLHVSLVRHRNGAPNHYIAQVQDLTARMEAEARYRLMAENATDMIVTSDLRGRTTFVSAGCMAITGWTPSEALGQDTESFVHPEDLETLRAAFRRTAAGEPAERVRWRGWHRGRQTWLWLESSPSLLSEGCDPCFVDVVRDVSAQVAQEEALAAARNEAEAAARAKSEFLANMSHEIRTPLTAVIGFSELLCAQAGLDRDARLFSDRIATAGKALLSVVNSILDFSKLEAGEVEIAPKALDIAVLCRETLALFGPQADAKALELSLSVDEPFPALVMADPQALRQVLLNLIGNAVKFTDRGGVTLRLAHRAERLLIAVSDTGAGLDLEQQAKLFQRFSQVDGSSTRRHGGTGLGLAICKGLVQAMGGRIGVNSAPGRGATFHVEVAAPVAAAAAAWAQAAPAASLEGVRVLVADDNAINRELARALLENLGAEVRFAADGVEAVETAQQLPFDCILLDLRMPRLDGASALRRIRGERGPNQDVPILAFSAGDPRETLPGFDGALSKPVTAAALLKAIATAIEAPSAARSADARHG